jgi:sterol 14-demethylase
MSEARFLETRDAPHTSAHGGSAPPRLSGSLPLLGHLLELRRAPIELFWRVRNECGEIGEMNWAGNRVVLLTGEAAQEAFFRSEEEQLDQAAAYPFMTPVFGRGVVFDGTPEQRRQAMRNQSLRDKMMRTHAETIAAETQRMMAKLGDAGEIDLLDFFSELTLYTSSACLIGKEFREELTPEYFRVFYELEKGTDAIAYVNPNLPLPVFRKRDRARRRLVELLTAVFERRANREGGARELFDVLLAIRNPDGTPRYTIDQVTGMFISMMFAGHHTTSGTAAWTLIELLRNPGAMEKVRAEVDAIYADGREVSYQALREIPELENGIKESLRLHPPLIILMRKVTCDFHYDGFTVPAGRLVAVSPAVSNRMPECFPNPDAFDPSRYAEGREEDRHHQMAWIPFGAGRHRCVGAAFAMMQLKAIFSDLLLRYDFELCDPPDSYRNDHSKMVVQLRQPCRARYRRRAA